MTRPFARFVVRQERRGRAHVAMAQAVMPFWGELGLLDEKGPLPFDRLLYRIFWWLVFLAVVFLPTWPGESTVYSLALLALIGAWLVAIPQVAHGLASADYSLVRPGRTALRTVMESFRKVKLDVPSMSAEEESEGAQLMGQLVPVLLPLVLVKMIFRLAVRALILSVVAMAGLLAGPAVAGIHWWRGWSPISLLFATTAGDALAMLGLLVVPVLVQTVLAALKLRDEANRIPDPDKPSD